MPIPFHGSATAKTVAQVRDERIAREMEIVRKSYRAQRKKIAKMRKSHLMNTRVLAGDRTENAKDLRKWSRQKMRIDKELSMNAYSVTPRGKYWYENVEMTLAVITHARMIIASREERKYDFEHPWPSEIKRPDMNKGGGEEK